MFFHPKKLLFSSYKIEYWRLSKFTDPVPEIYWSCPALYLSLSYHKINLNKLFLKEKKWSRIKFKFFVPSISHEHDFETVLQRKIAIKIFQIFVGLDSNRQICLHICWSLVIKRTVKLDIGYMYLRFDFCFVFWINISMVKSFNMYLE